MSKLWGGRFTGKTDPDMEAFNASLPYDKAMCFVDLDGSVAWTKALLKSKLVTAEEQAELVRGLELVRQEWQNGTFVAKGGDEDIHTANERRLTELIGKAIAGKLHTGRSRNDQVATDMRLWCRAEVAQLGQSLRELIEVLATRAQQDIGVLMSGYTHLQCAQPILWSHWVMSHAAALRRDAERLEQLTVRLNVSPLGSGALAGNPFGADRQLLADELGFNGITANSLDAVSDRDFVSEIMFWATMTMTHLSKWAEDLIIYSTKEFGFVTLADAYSTGSSLMPQKKNPDSLELIRGKAGRIFGNLSGFLMTCKGLPSTYNKDLQEDKEPLFDTVKNMQMILRIATGVMATATIHPERMQASLKAEMLATDLAYYLVRRGVPFRQAHSLSGQCVALAETNQCELSALSTADFKTVSEVFEDDVAKVFDFKNAVEQYSVPGGTATSSVLAQVADTKAWLESKKQ